MDKIIQIGNLYPDLPNFKNRTSGRVYGLEGIAPTLNTAGGGTESQRLWKRIKLYALTAR